MTPIAAEALDGRIEAELERLLRALGVDGHSPEQSRWRAYEAAKRHMRRHVIADGAWQRGVGFVIDILGL